MDASADLTDIQICARDLRQQDRDRYLCCLFLPQRERMAAFALYAFYHEVAKTADVVSETMLGEIRLQWWRDALDEIYAGTPRRHPVVQALGQAVEAHDLPKPLLLALVDARTDEIEGKFPTSQDGFKRHLIKTAAPLFELLLLCAKEEAHDLAEQAALGYGIPGIMRAAGLDVAQGAQTGRKALPADLAKALARDAEAALLQARSQGRKLNKTARRMLLPLSLAEGHLKRLEKAGYDHTDPRFIDPASNPVPRLAAKAFLNRF